VVDKTKAPRRAARGCTPKQWGNPKGGYHKSHGSGRDFDVQIIRTDGKEAPRSITVKSALYDQARTQVLVDILHSVGGARLDMIGVTPESGLTGERLKNWSDHVYHLHVRLK